MKSIEEYLICSKKSPISLNTKAVIRKTKKNWNIYIVFNLLYFSIITSSCKLARQCFKISSAYFKFNNFHPTYSIYLERILLQCGCHAELSLLLHYAKYAKSFNADIILCLYNHQINQIIRIQINSFRKEQSASDVVATDPTLTQRTPLVQHSSLLATCG